jgi:small subunit ribosomal protein S6
MRKAVRDKTKMPLYECVMLARQEVSGPQVDAVTDEMTGVITEGGGQVSKKEYWGLRNLTYRIKKNRKAHYVLLNIDAPVAAVKEMERRLALNEDVLRTLTIRVDSLEEGPSAMMQAKSGRDDRDGRGERGDRPRRDFREGGFRGDREGGFRGDREDRGDRPRRDAREGGEA